MYTYLGFILVYDVKAPTFASHRQSPTFEKPALRADVCSRTGIKLKLKLNEELWRTLTNAINENRTGVNKLRKANCRVLSRIQFQGV